MSVGCCPECLVRKFAVLCTATVVINHSALHTSFVASWAPDIQGVISEDLKMVLIFIHVLLFLA